MRRVYDAVGHLAQIFYLGKNFNEQVDCNVRVPLMSKFFTTYITFGFLKFFGVSFIYTSVEYKKKKKLTHILFIIPPFLSVVAKIKINKKLYIMYSL